MRHEDRGQGLFAELARQAVQAHAESYVGLVETGVGLVPAWGGCKEMLMRLAADPKRPHGPMAPVAQAFQTIGLADVAKSDPDQYEKFWSTFGVFLKEGATADFTHRENIAKLLRFESSKSEYYL